jgi:hypothetical protein
MGWCTVVFGELRTGKWIASSCWDLLCPFFLACAAALRSPSVLSSSPPPLPPCTLQLGNVTLVNSTITSQRQLPPWVCTSQSSNGADCDISVHNHTQVVLNLPRGLGPFVQLRISVVSATMTSESSAVVFNYSLPVIKAVSQNPLNARGGELVNIYGENLGLVSLGPRPVVHLNGTWGLID